MLLALRIRSFRKLAAIYSVNLFAEWFGSIALMVLVYGATGSATVAGAMLVCKQILPGFLAPLFAGIVSRFASGKVLAVAFTGIGVALLLAGMAGYGPLLFGLAAVVGTGGALARSTLRSTVSATLAGAELRSGNAFLNVVMGVAAPLGPGCAAAVVAAWGASSALELAAVVYLALAVGVAVAGPSRAAALASTERADSSSDEPQTSAAERHLHHVPVAWLLALVGLVTCVYSMDEPALLAFSEHGLGAGVHGYGAIYAAWGTGAAAGSLIFARLLHWPMLRVYAMATALSGLGYLAMGATSSLTVAVGVALVGGLGSGMDWVAIVTAIQEATKPGDEARIATRLEGVAMASPAVGVILGGLLADAASPRVTVLATGVLTLSVLALGALAVRARGARAHVSRPVVLSSSIQGGSA